MQLYRFAMGRTEADVDQPFIDAMTADFKQSNFQFSNLLLDFVTMPAFGYRLMD